MKQQLQTWFAKITCNQNTLNQFLHRKKLLAELNKHIQVETLQFELSPQFNMKLSKGIIHFMQLRQLLSNKIVYVTAQKGKIFSQAEMVAISNFFQNNETILKQLFYLNWEVIEISTAKPLLPLRLPIATSIFYCKKNPCICLQGFLTE